LDEKIGEEEEKEEIRKGESPDEGKSGKGQGPGKGKGGREAATGEGAMALGGMEAVGFEIEDVVESVGGTGGEIEDAESPENLEKESGVEKLASEEKGGKDAEVFDPMDRPRKLE